MPTSLVLTSNIRIVAATGPGGTARQHVVQFRCPGQIVWNRWGAFSHIDEAVRQRQLLEQQNFDTRLVSYRLCATSP